MTNKKLPTIHYPITKLNVREHSITACGWYISNSRTSNSLTEITCKSCLKEAYKTSKVKLCLGCADDFYNGNNNLGVKECWNLKSSKVVRLKLVGINDTPPWVHQPILVTLSCHKKRGYVLVEPTRIN